MEQPSQQSGAAKHSVPSRGDARCASPLVFAAEPVDSGPTHGFEHDCEGSQSSFGKARATSAITWLNVVVFPLPPLGVGVSRATPGSASARCLLGRLFTSAARSRAEPQRPPAQFCESFKAARAARQDGEVV